MKVTVDIPGVGTNIEADLSTTSFSTISRMGMKDALVAILRAYVDVYGDEYIYHELGEDIPGLTDEEIGNITTSLWQLLLSDKEDDLIPAATIATVLAIRNGRMDELIESLVRDTIEERAGVYKVTVTCEVERTLYVRAASESDISDAIDYHSDISSFMEDADWTVKDVSIHRDDDHYYDCTVGDI